MAGNTRHPVAQGGFWSQPKATYSKETQALMKQMMKESKLTNFQQRQLSSAMQGGGTLPTSCHPTSSAKPKPPPPQKIQSARVDPRQVSAVRTREQIEATGAYERAKFVPITYSTYYEKDKERLANIMAYGQDIPPPDKKKLAKMAAPKEVKEIDRFEELENEIEERRNFLADMESVGRGDKYRPIIETEISQKIREMEVIDIKRSEELRQAIEADKKNRYSKPGIPQPSVS